MAMLSVMGLYRWNQTIFDDMTLPSLVDRETVISNILTECAELECVIPDPDVLKEVIKYWSKKNSENWQRMYDAMAAEYNPLYNKDAFYEESEDRNLKSTGESVGRVSAFNTNTFQNSNQSSAEGTDTGTIKRSRREYGNIGVTSSMQLVQEEMELRSDWNIYDVILADFKSRFCILVY